ncbi:MAG: peptide chain release factor N(5)-glutamine methyltransferase [Anaerorhabdus sp.]|uniref:peptide chain release factor N(5)-glutamine methyltransferase n=1 Tax=Anaerorhabdus sp. TaxID=1872524 RepID=UPI003A861A31
MPTFKQLIHQYTEACNKIDLPEQTALTYIVELTQKNRVDLYMNYDENVPVDVLKEYEEGMQRILKHEPMQHVLGYSWFYGYQFIVNPNVLIPRPETEELVSHILANIDEHFPTGDVLCADIGTGSGAIAIAVAKEEARVCMLATDISEEAVEVAKKNALNNGASVEFMVGDMLEPIISKEIKLDVLISNPPYIPQQEVLEESVIDFEPHVALFGGEDGLKFYRTILENCHKVLKDKAFIAFEMGWDQAKALTSEVKKYIPNAQSEVIKDMNGKDRMLLVYYCR